MNEVLLKFIIPLTPVTKKNSGRIITTETGKKKLLPSKAYTQYEKDAGYFLPRKHEHISVPINVKAVYYMPSVGRVDLINLHSALHDVLVCYGVLKDDSADIIVSTDGSRVEVDPKNPRTEVEITEIQQEVQANGKIRHRMV